MVFKVFVMLAKFHIRGNLTLKFANLGPTWSQLFNVIFIGFNMTTNVGINMKKNVGPNMKKTVGPNMQNNLGIILM